MVEQNNLGNIELIEYGIFQYDSDYCAHVGFDVCMIFLYETEYMKNFILNNNFRTASAFQDNIKTAQGFLIPWDKPDLIIISLPQLNKKYSFCSDTSIKGKWAVDIVKHSLKLGMVPFRFKVNEITDKDMQLKGKDIIAISSFSIQVKCDWKAGPKEKGGTGNLFIQTHECNPLGKH